MPPSGRCRHGVRLSITATLVIIISLMIFSSKPDEIMSKKLVLGSRPPNCVNKCMSCRPCMATLVVPPRHLKKQSSSSIPSSTSYDNNYEGNNHDSYYLLSWKCKCGNKLFQP